MYQVSPFTLVIVWGIQRKVCHIIILHSVEYTRPKVTYTCFRASVGLRYFVLALYVLYLPHHSFARRLVTE